MNWSNIFNNNFGRINYGGGNPGWGGNYGGGGNYGAVQARYGGDTQILPNLNTQSTMNTTGTSFMSNNNSGGWGNAGGFGFNTGWGNRSNEFGRYSNYVNQQPDQPYNRFLIEGFNPGFEQYGVLGARLDRQEREKTIGYIGHARFWGREPGYPLNLYNV
jgi:hypothetical protein